MIAQLFWSSFGAVVCLVLAVLISWPEDINDVFEEDEEQ